MGNLRDGGVVAVGKPLDGEQQLMLLGRDVLAAGSLFAKSKEATDGIAKRSDRFKVSIADQLVVRQCLMKRP